MTDMEYANPNLLNLTNSISSVVSIVLALLAIGLSVYFFVQSRNVQENVRTALAEITTQAGVLQKISFKQLDRLTRFVTERPDQQQDQQQLNRFLDATETISNVFQENLNHHQEGIQKLVAETITCYISIYYYSALTNYWAQGYLPPLDQFDEQNKSHVLARRAVDSSARDFSILAEILNKVTSEQLQASPMVNLLNEAQQTWRPFVRTSQQVFTDRTM